MLIKKHVVLEFGQNHICAIPRDSIILEVFHNNITIKRVIPLSSFCLVMLSNLLYCVTYCTNCKIGSLPLHHGSYVALHNVAKTGMGTTNSLHATV